MIAHPRDDFLTRGCYKHGATDMPVYTSYVLRVWRVEQAGGWKWRAMLERISTGERTGFTDLPSLVAFLQADQPAETSRARTMDMADADEDEGSWTDLEDKNT